MTQSHLLIAQEGGLARLTFNRPEARNALSPEMVEGLLAFFLRAESDPGIRCIVLEAAGKHFMAGGDIKSFALMAQQEPQQRRQAFEARIHKGSQIFAVMQRIPQPVVCCVQGTVAGAGMGFVSAADLVIAADNASFVMAYVSMGVSLDAGVSYHLPRAIGLKRAKAMALLAQPVDARTAADHALVDRVVPLGDLAAECDRIARGLATGPSVAIGQIKSLMNQSLNRSLVDQLAAEAVGMGIVAATDDFIEGPQAFLDKRKPEFKGR